MPGKDGQAGHPGQPGTSEVQVLSTVGTHAREVSALFIGLNLVGISLFF